MTEHDFKDRYACEYTKLTFGRDADPQSIGNSEFYDWVYNGGAIAAWKKNRGRKPEEVARRDIAKVSLEIAYAAVSPDGIIDIYSTCTDRSICWEIKEDDKNISKKELQKEGWQVINVTIKPTRNVYAKRRQP